MKMGSLIELQVEFVCQRCGRAGFTPDITADSALTLATGAAHIRCPQCSHIVEVVTTAKEVKAAAKAKYQQLVAKVVEFARVDAERRAQNAQQH